jgi:hypothetical protein
MCGAFAGDFPQIGVEADFTQEFASRRRIVCKAAVEFCDFYRSGLSV